MIGAEAAVPSRRSVLVGFAASILLAEGRSFAQQVSGRLARIGFLRFSDEESGRPYVESLRRGLRDLGYTEGKHFIVEARFAGGVIARVAEMAAELAKRRVDIIVTTDTPATRAVQQVTNTIPVVMVNVIDPVGSGFVTSFARPGGNITGLTSMTGDISTKHLQILGMAIPKLSRIAVLVNPNNPAHGPVLADIESTSRRLGATTAAFEAGDLPQIDAAFAAIATAKPQALIVVADAFFAQQRHQLAQLLLQHQLPSISANREYAEAGALMSYGQNFQENTRRAAIFV